MQIQYVWLFWIVISCTCIYISCFFCFFLYSTCKIFALAVFAVLVLIISCTIFRYYDYVSTFYVNDDGKIWRHDVTKVSIAVCRCHFPVTFTHLEKYMYTFDLLAHFFNVSFVGFCCRILFKQQYVLVFGANWITPCDPISCYNMLMMLVATEDVLYTKICS